MKLRFGFILLMMLLASVHFAQVTVRQPVKWAPIDAGSDSRLTQEYRGIISSQAEFEDYLYQAFGSRRSHLRMDIDWRRHQLAVFHYGRCFSEDLEVYVESIQLGLTGGVTINYAHIMPSIQHRPATRDCNPYMIVLMERQNGSIFFTKKMTSIPSWEYYGQYPPPTYGDFSMYGYPNRYGCNCRCQACLNAPIVVGTEYSPVSDVVNPNRSSLPAIQWRTFKTGTVSRFSEPQTHILKTDGAFQAYWMDMTGMPASQAPKGVDWNKQWLIAIHLGETAAQGTSVYVETVVRSRPDEITVKYVVSAPAAGSKTKVQVAQPYVIIAMDRAPGQILFSRRNVERRTIIATGQCGCKGRCGCRCCR